MLVSLLDHFADTSIDLGSGGILVTRGTAAAQTLWLAQDSTQETEERGALASGWTDTHTKLFILPKQTETKSKVKSSHLYRRLECGRHQDKCGNSLFSS